jgi:hypothetical protein
MSLEKPLVYIILGAAGSGRRDVLADLVEAGLGADDRAAVLLAANEGATEADNKLPAIARWSWVEGEIAAALPAEATHVFFVADGRMNPVDLLEKFPGWLAASGGELGRVITVVNCTLAEKHPALQVWYEACIHFSDIALLNHRDGVANKWMSTFLARFKALCLPCLFELVKAGRVKNPLIVLEPQARRMSHIFDVTDWTGIDTTDIEFGEDGDLDSDDDGDAKTAKADKAKPKKKGRAGADEEPDEDDWKPTLDPYFVLDAAGRRKMALPDIAAYLAKG